MNTNLDPVGTAVPGEIPGEIRVRTAPPVSVRVRVRVSFSYGVTLLRILFLNLGPPFPGLPKAQ